MLLRVHLLGRGVEKKEIDFNIILKRIKEYEGALFYTVKNKKCFTYTIEGEALRPVCKSKEATERRKPLVPKAKVQLVFEMKNLNCQNDIKKHNKSIPATSYLFALSKDERIISEDQ